MCVCVCVVPHSFGRLCLGYIGVFEIFETIGYCNPDAAEVWDGCAEGQTGGVGVMQVIALVLPACAIALMSKKV